MREGDAEALLGVREPVVLAVVAVALRMGEDDDAVGLERREGVLDRLGGLGLAGVAGGVDALLLEPLDGLLLRGVGLGDRVVVVGDPEGDLGAGPGGGDDEHLGALDLLSERGAEGVGVDGLRGHYQQLHAGCVAPGGGWSNGVERSTTTATSSRRCPSWTASAVRSTASAIVPAWPPPTLCSSAASRSGASA